VHEVGIIQEAVRMAVEAARHQGASRVTCIRLRVGVMSGVVPEALSFAFDLAIRETMAQGATLEIETVTPACWCARCQQEFDCADYVNECPQCGDMSNELRRGKELDLISVEVE